MDALLTRCVFSDNSGTITYDEFKNVFKDTINGDSIPFNFDWCVFYFRSVVHANSA